MCVENTAHTRMLVELMTVENFKVRAGPLDTAPCFCHSVCIKAVKYHVYLCTVCIHTEDVDFPILHFL